MCQSRNTCVLSLSYALRSWLLDIQSPGWPFTFLPGSPLGDLWSRARDLCPLIRISSPLAWLPGQRNRKEGVDVAGPTQDPGMWGPLTLRLWGTSLEKQQESRKSSLGQEPCSPDKPTLINLLWGCRSSQEGKPFLSQCKTGLCWPCLADFIL